MAVLYITRLEIKNFRCFENTSFELNHPGRQSAPEHPTPTVLPSVNLFLGGNGSGKSSVFRALVLSALAPIISSSGLQAEYLVRRKGGADESSPGIPIIDQAEISVTLSLNVADLGTDATDGREERSSVTVLRQGDFESVVPPTNWHEGWQSMLTSNSSPGFFLVGYGANRRSERPEGYSERNRAPRYQRVAGLFEEHVGLAPFTYAYLQLKDRSWLEEARAILNSVLPESLELTDQTDTQSRPLFAWNDVHLPFGALSDGYRAFVAWVWDLLYQVAIVYPSGADRKLSDLTGVVVIDEIDLFLHPEWQRVVVKQLAEAFPNLQIMLSSHSPLVAGALEPSNIFVLEGDKVTQYQEQIYGMSAGEVLTSSYFGLASTRAPGSGTLTDLAKLTLGIEEDDVANVQANPEDEVQPRSDAARAMFKTIASRARAETPVAAEEPLAEA